MKNNNFNIDFKPMISELKPRDLNNIQYSTTSFLFKRFPQWFLFIFNKLKLVFFALAFVYFGLSILFSTVFGISWFLDKVLIVVPICMVLTFLSFHMDVQSNVGSMREAEFNRHNDENVFWSPLDLDDDMREDLNIYDVIGALNISNKYAQANNVLGFKDSKMSTGDIVYYTREYDIDGDDTMKRHGCPYVAMPMNTQLPSMKLLRKKFDYAHLKRRNSIEMPNGELSSLIIKNVRRGSSDKIISALSENDLGSKFEELFAKHPDIVSLKIFNDLVLISCLYEIPGDFNSRGALPNKIVSQYNTRLSILSDLKDILKS